MAEWAAFGDIMYLMTVNVVVFCALIALDADGAIIGLYLLSTTLAWWLELWRKTRENART